MKSCFKCEEEKPLAEYYRHKRMADGHLNKCKVCTKEDVAKHRASNLEKIRAYDRARGNRQPVTYLAEYAKANPEKRAAHVAVGNAVRDGKLIKPDQCSECDSTFHIEGHHDDYSKPLEVRWLCSACHKQHHANEAF
jgi:hypothetical protein